MPTSSAQTIAVDLAPSAVGQALVASLYAAGTAAIFIAHFPVATKIGLLAIVLLFAFARRQKRRNSLCIRRLQIDPEQKVTIRDLRGRARSAEILKFERIICYYLAMRLQVENRGEERIHIFADAIDADAFRVLRSFALQYRDRHAMRHR